MKPENARHLEDLLSQVHQVLLHENMVRGGDWSFTGWTADGRSVKHKVRIDGFERAGPTAERKRSVNLAAK